jgi:hypothetical protein
LNAIAELANQAILDLGIGAYAHIESIRHERVCALERMVVLLALAPRSHIGPVLTSVLHGSTVPYDRRCNLMDTIARVACGEHLRALISALSGAPPGVVTSTTEALSRNPRPEHAGTLVEELKSRDAARTRVVVKVLRAWGWQPPDQDSQNRGSSE